MPERKPSPRINVVVTEEQQALLFELARLDPETRSASSFLRKLLDGATPLLRVTVPMMRAAAEEMDASREGLRGPLRDFIAEVQQMDLLDRAAPGTNHTERSEGGRAKRRPRKQP
jgi:hypothetical protein